MTTALDQVPTASQLNHVHQSDDLPTRNHSHVTNATAHTSTQQLIPHHSMEKTLLPLYVGGGLPPG